MTDKKAIEMYETDKPVYHVIFAPGGVYRAEETYIGAYQVSKDEPTIYFTSRLGVPKVEKNYAENLFETEDSANKRAEQMMEKFVCYVIVEPEEYREFKRWKERRDGLD